jgi:hypothetical protein
LFFSSDKQDLSTCLGHAVLDALSSLPGAEVEVDLLSLIDGLDDELVKHYGGAQAAQKNHKRD